MNCISHPACIRLILLFTLLFPFAVIAETELAMLMGSEDEFLDELPIILSATRLPQPLNEAPVAMTIIDREMIDASGARTIADLLRLAPGFQVGYFDGNSPVVTYHGHSDEQSRRIQVLIDGRSVYVPSLAATQWSDLIISVEEIERIEVIRGPNAATYGNNSFLAVISIITRQAIEDQGHKIKLLAGSHDTSDTLYRFGGQSENIDYRVTVGEQDDSGTDLLNDYSHSNHISYRIDNQLNNNSQLSYQGGYKSNRKGDHESPPDFQIEAETVFQWLKWDHQTENNNQYSLQYYYNCSDENLSNENQIIKLGEFSDPATKAFLDPIDAFLPAPISIKSQRHDLEFNYTFNFDTLRLISGVSARLDIVSAENVFRTNDTQRHELYRFFTHGEYRFRPDWILNTGFMIENNDISGTDISPRLSLIHHLNKNNTIRAGISKATRTPTLFDQNAYININQQLTDNGGTVLDAPYQALLGGTDVLMLVDLTSVGDVDSEEIVSMELGYITRLLKNRLLLDFKISKDNTNNLIGVTQNDLAVAEDNFDFAATDIQNTHKTSTKSFEFSADYKPSKDIRLYGHYAYIDIEAEMFNPLGRFADTDRLRVSAPKNTYSLMLVKHWPKKINTSLMYYYVDTFDWTDRTRNRGSEYWKDRNVHAYKKIDIKFDKTWSYGMEKLNIALILQNLAEDFYDYNRPEYTDASLTTVAPTSNTINKNGSLQDRRAYIELSFLFN